MRLSQDVVPHPTIQRIRNRARCIKLILPHDHCWHRHTVANTQELISLSLLLWHFDEVFVVVLLFRSTSYHALVNMSSSSKAAMRRASSHTPNWKERK
jgi:hypothetical protein